MYLAQIEGIKRKLVAIKSIINFKRNLLEYFPGEREWAGDKLLKLMNSTPDMHHWKIYDHTACLSSLYTSYEIFIHELIEKTVINYAKYFDYAGLPSSLRDQHRQGVAEILTKLTHPMYLHLSQEGLGGEMALNNKKKGDYKITPESIYKHDKNIRMDLLGQLFNRVGFGGIKQWLDNSSQLRNILDDSFSGHNQVEGLLRDFVDRRNDCNHGEVDEILGESQLIFFCDFIYQLCEDIYDFCCYNMLKVMLDNGFAKINGEVLEGYSNQIYVAKITSGSFSIGSNIFCLKENYCKSPIIENIQIDDADCLSASVIHELEMGFKMNINIRKGAKIISGS